MNNFSKKFYSKIELAPKNYKDKLPEYMELTSEKSKDESAFGNNNTTVLSWHHQWLYGRSAPLACLNVLDFLDMTKDSNYTTNPFSAEHLEYYGGLYPKDVAKSITSVMSMFNDRQLMPYTRNAGIEKFSFLNYEEPEMREDFTKGDNNDGIFIIDVNTKKYCFINIYEHDLKGTSIKALPLMTPCSAIEYIEAYYPSTMTKGAIEHIKWLKGKKNRGNKNQILPSSEIDKTIEKDVEKYIKEMQDNIKINKKFAKRFKKYGILTPEEIQAMFPKMEIPNVKKHIEVSLVDKG